MTYPFSFARYFIVYCGGGGHFETISITPVGGTTPDANYSNDSLIITAGGKFRYPFETDKDGRKYIGLDAGYGRTFGGNRTNYDLLKIGAVFVYEFD